MRPRRALRATGTVSEDRTALLRWVGTRGGWVPIAEAVRWYDARGISRTAGDYELRTLCLTGELERRASREGYPPAYEYRVPR